MPKSREIESLYCCSVQTMAAAVAAASVVCGGGGRGLCYVVSQPHAPIFSALVYCWGVVVVLWSSRRFAPYSVGADTTTAITFSYSSTTTLTCAHTTSSAQQTSRSSLSLGFSGWRSSL